MTDSVSCYTKRMVVFAGLLMLLFLVFYLGMKGVLNYEHTSVNHHTTTYVNMDRAVEEYLTQYRGMCSKFGWRTITVYIPKEGCESEDVIIPLGIVYCGWYLDPLYCDCVVVTTICINTTEVAKHG